MTVLELSNQIGAQVLVEAGGMDRPVTGGYVCDFLSFVIGKAADGDAWITVMGNVNTIAVATLTDVACILLAENTPLDADAKEKAGQNGIPVLRSEKTAYQLAVELSKLLEKERS